MKYHLAILLFAGLAFSEAAEQQWCYKNVSSVCANSLTPDMEPQCNSKYGSFNHNIQTQFSAYMREHIDFSHHFLMAATHFDSYETNREGFKKLFRELSDEAWKKSIEIVKYVGKRGGVVNFSAKPKEINDPDKVYEKTEIGSMALAVDMFKSLTESASHIHREATKNHDSHHDPEVASFIEDEFAAKHAEIIRKLSGYTNDLQKLLVTNDRDVGLYVFNEYLLKQHS